jgi:hypothetical protein
VKRCVLRSSLGGRVLTVVIAAILAGNLWHAAVWAQTAGVRGFGGGVGQLFNLPGPGNLYIDNQGTQGFIYNFGNNFESYSFRNPATGQAWSGGIMTLGPQLSIGLIQGANQAGSPLLLVPPPRDVSPLPPVESTTLEIP